MEYKKNFVERPAAKMTYYSLAVVIVLLNFFVLNEVFCEKTEVSTRKGALGNLVAPTWNLNTNTRDISEGIYFALNRIKFYFA